jgi:hypothetical protein
MTIIVPFDLTYEFDVKASVAEVFALLADVPLSASHFPKLGKLVDLGDQIYRWEMKRIGTAKMSIQTVYACKYEADSKQGTVKWTPVKGVGNASISGNWKIGKKKTGSHVVLEISGELQVALPGLMKGMITPMVTAENETLISIYIENLTKHFDGKG